MGPVAPFIATLLVALLPVTFVLLRSGQRAVALKSSPLRVLPPTRLKVAHVFEVLAGLFFTPFLLWWGAMLRTAPEQLFRTGIVVTAALLTAVIPLPLGVRKGGNRTDQAPARDA